MIKIQALLTRRPDLNLEQFDKHWHSPHGDPLTLNIKLVRHLVENARLADADGLITSSYDGNPQVWFETLEDALGLQSDPAYAEADDDQEHFMDRPKLKFLLLKETAIDGEVGPGDGQGVNLMLLASRRPDATQEQFDAEFITADDAELGRALGATRHIVSRSLPEAYTGEEPPAYDAVRELFFEDLDSLQAAKAKAPDAWAALLKTPAIDPANSAVYVAHQRRLR